MNAAHEWAATCASQHSSSSSLLPPSRSPPPRRAVSPLGCGSLFHSRLSLSSAFVRFGRVRLQQQGSARRRYYVDSSYKQCSVWRPRSASEECQLSARINLSEAVTSSAPVNVNAQTTTIEEELVSCACTITQNLDFVSWPSAPRQHLPSATTRPIAIGISNAADALPN